MLKPKSSRLLLDFLDYCISCYPRLTEKQRNFFEIKGIELKKLEDLLFQLEDDIKAPFDQMFEVMFHDIEEYKPIKNIEYNNKYIKKANEYIHKYNTLRKDIQTIVKAVSEKAKSLYHNPRTYKEVKEAIEMYFCTEMLY